MRIVAQVEIDDFCRRVLAKHWPDVPRWDDVTTLDCDEVLLKCGPIDAVVGGVPCQPASVAGRRKGGTDSRWLWPAVLRVVREINPVWVLAENVPGLVSLPGGAFDGILSAIETMGYEVQTYCFGAGHAGSPHQRRRIWLVAHTDRVSTGESEQLPQCEVSSVVAADRSSWLAPDAASTRRNGRTEQDNSGQETQHTRILTDDEGHSWGLSMPPLLRGVHGAPRLLDRTARVKALGNSVVPACAEMIGRAILEGERNER